MENQKPRLYLASPLFSLSERRFNSELKLLLSECFEVFLPQENGNLFVNLVAEGLSIPAAAKTIFTTDINAIEDSGLVLIVLDGRTIDEGAVFELGYAFARNKICIGLQTDMRRLLPIGNNPMIDCALRHVFEDIDSLLRWARNEFSGPICREMNDNELSNK